MLVSLHCSCEGIFFNTHNSNFLFWRDPYLRSRFRLELCVTELFKSFGKAALAGLSVDRWKILSCFFHNSYYLVEADSVKTVSIQGIDTGIHCSGRSICISFDTRNLDKSSDRVASETEMMFKSHFGSVFDL